MPSDHLLPTAAAAVGGVADSAPPVLPGGGGGEDTVMTPHLEETEVSQHVGRVKLSGDTCGQGEAEWGHVWAG